MLSSAVKRFAVYEWNILINKICNSRILPIYLHELSNTAHMLPIHGYSSYTCDVTSSSKVDPIRTV